MRRVGGRFWKFAILCHRWLGLTCCLLFVLWLTSGIVMMYWEFPGISAEERLSKTAPLTPPAIRMSPEAAFGIAQGEAPDQAWLSMLDGRPVYHFRSGGSETLVRADGGEILQEIPRETALRIASAWTSQPASAARFEGSLSDADQWTVSGEFAALRPLLMFSWPNGEELYVSAITGEVVQHTTRGSRIGAYFGAIPHWLYFTPLRKNESLWNSVVIWTSGIGALVSLLGLIAGIWMYSPSKRYRFRGDPSSIPYTGQKRWHMMLGLIFGTVTCTWVFSGMLSMEPFEWLRGSDGGAIRIANALRGGHLDMTAFRPKPPGAALEQATSGQVKEMEFIVFGGQPFYLARESPRHSRIVPISGDTAEQFDRNRILQLVAEASRPASVSQSRLVAEYEAYYLDRHHRHPLPVLFVRLNDSLSSMYYIDLKTARIVESYDDRSRWNRWLYHGLHSWDLPWLYRNRPAWDVLVLMLLLGGTSLSVTSVVIGLQFLRRKLTLRRSTVGEVGAWRRKLEE